MKHALLHLALLAALPTMAQDNAPLTLWTDAGGHGYTHIIAEPGHYDHLRPELHGHVSALQVADGYTVIVHDAEDGDGLDRLTLTGPCRIDDLKTRPRLHGPGHWDDAVRSLNIEVSAKPQEPGVPAEIAHHPP